MEFTHLIRVVLNFILSLPPVKGELDKLLNRIAHRVVKFLEKKGLLVRDEMGQEYLSIEATQSMDQIQGASLTYKIALGKYKGKKALTFQSIPLMEKTKDKFLSRYAGFSLHCGVACPANDRKKLERVCRYISRPSLSEGGGKIKVIAAIEDPEVIEKILKHLGLDWTAPQPSPSRGRLHNRKIGIPASLNKV